MRTIVGLTTRIIFWLTAIYFVGALAIGLFMEGNVVFAVLALVFFPLSYFAFPLLAGQWWLLLISIGAYALSTFYGKLEPVD